MGGGARGGAHRLDPRAGPLIADGERVVVDAEREVDVAILGAGTAGLAAYHAAVALTDRVVLIDGGPVGTTCARVGCMPSKLLIAAADAAHGVAGAHRFGLGEPRRAEVDGVRVMDRIRRERDRFVGFVTRAVAAIPERHLLRENAAFLDARTLAVGGAAPVTVRARSVVVATGSRPMLLPMFDGLGDRLLVSHDLFDWRSLPESVAVFGPGIVGLELGQALHRLGVRLRIFGKGGFVGPLTDPEIRDESQRIIGAELPLHPDADVKRLAREGDRVAVTFVVDGETLTERFDYVLAAIGRVPNVEGFGLEHTGLALDKRGVPLFDRATLRCGESSIFLAGDANADAPLLHEASDEGAIAGANAARFPDVRPGLRRSPLAVVFTDPQIALVGETWAEVRDRHPVVGRVSFADQGRARVLLVNTGRLHVYADRATGRLLGAEMVGPCAEHLAHLLAWAHQLGLTVPRMLGLPFYHPVIEEGLRTALRDASAQLSKDKSDAPVP